MFTDSRLCKKVYLWARVMCEERGTLNWCSITARNKGLLRVISVAVYKTVCKQVEHFTLTLTLYFSKFRREERLVKTDSDICCVPT